MIAQQQVSDRSYRSPSKYQQYSNRAVPRHYSKEFEATESESAPVTVVKYPYLRTVLSPEQAVLPAEQLEAFMESQYGRGSAEQYDEYFEGFFGDVGSFITSAATTVGRGVVQAAPIVANIAGGVVRGATTGASLGLPGIIGGAVAGGVGQGFASYGSGTLRDIGKGINTGIGVAGQLTGTGRIGSAVGGALSGIGQGQNVLNSALGSVTSLAGGALGGGAVGKVAGLVGGQGGGLSAITSLLGGTGQAGQTGSAASQLIALLQRPEVMQSLGSLTMGLAGRTTIPIGSAQMPVPTSAFVNLLGLLANRAVDEQAALSDGSESDLRYLMDDAGEWMVDPVESEQRAAHLYYLLNVAEYDRMIQADQQQQSLQQQQLRQQAVYQERARQARAWQYQRTQETAMYDAVDLSETYALPDEVEEYEEYDRYGEYEEYEEYNEYDEQDEYDEHNDYLEHNDYVVE